MLDSRPISPPGCVCSGTLKSLRNFRPKARTRIWSSLSYKCLVRSSAAMLVSACLFRSRRFFVSSPLWTPQVYGPTSTKSHSPGLDMLVPCVSVYAGLGINQHGYLDAYVQTLLGKPQLSAPDCRIRAAFARQRPCWSRVCVCAQGYLAHKKTLTPLRPP